MERRAGAFPAAAHSAPIFILRDRQHDAIFAELKRRRLAALKAMAEPDPLLSASEQANVLGALRERGIIDAQEVPILIARAQPSARPTIH
jgi:hypothetical protein